MPETKINCDHCGFPIKIYYSKNYGGNRGKCHACGVDFPLD